MKTEIYRLPTNSPDDVDGLRELVENSVVDPEEIVAIIGKTEGNGELNDFTRGFANFAIQTTLSRYTGETKETIAKRIPMIQSGGCEGVMTPHINVFVRKKDDSAPDERKRFSVGIFSTEDLLPEDIGTMRQVYEVAEGIKEAMHDAEISDPEDVHFVQMKTPLLRPEDIAKAKERGRDIPQHIASESMAYSNASSALGVALAMGEVSEDQLNDDTILQRLDLYSTVACPSSGIELRNCQIVLLGNSEKSTSNSIIGHAVMRNPLDAKAVLEAMKSAGLEFDGLPEREDLDRVQLAIAKSGIAPDGRVLGRRTTLVTDPELGGRSIRAVVNAVIGSVIGDPLVCVSGAPTIGTHSGPPGGGILAVAISQ